MEGPAPTKIRTGPLAGAGPVRSVGFAPADTSPSSVLRQHDGGSPASARGEPVESPLATALKRVQSERTLPALPKLKLGNKPKGMPRSKSQGNLRQPAAVEVPPPATQTRSATSSPHASSSAGSEPVRIE